MPKKLYKIEVAKGVKKDLKNLPKKDLLKIAILIESLASEPYPDGCKKLKGVDELYRVRQGDYRILYSVKNKVLTVLILKVAHRSKVYDF